MTVSLLLSSITGAIADLSIQDVTIKDHDGIAASWVSTPNVLYPNPEGFITNFRVEYDTLLRGDAPLWVLYTLNYRFLGTQLGDLATLPVAYTAMIEKVARVAAALIMEDAPYSGKVEMEVASIVVGARVDPAGNQFHGADIALNVKEMQN